MPDEELPANYQKLAFYNEEEIYDVESFPILDNPHVNASRRESALPNAEAREKRRKGLIKTRIYTLKTTTTERAGVPVIERLGTLLRVKSESAFLALKKNFTFIASQRPNPSDPHNPLPDEELCFLHELNAVPEEEIPPGLGEIFKMYSETTRNLERMRQRNLDLQKEVQKGGGGISRAEIDTLKRKAETVIENNTKILLQTIMQNQPKADMTPEQRMQFGEKLISALLMMFKTNWQKKIDWS